MLSQSSLLSALTLCSSVAAYPQIMGRQLGVGPVNPPFDAASQYVSNTGAHAFVPPGPGDSRSGCPALNALANHNYINHNGSTSVTQLVPILSSVMGMGEDVGTVLSMIAVMSTGDRKSLDFTIGNWGEMFMGFDHNQFKGLYDMGSLNATNFPEVVSQKYAAQHDGTLDNSTDPIASAQLGPLVDTLIFRCMANKSAEYPGGLLTNSLELPFLGEKNNGDDTFTKNCYHETIPDQWYTRNAQDQWTAAYLALDIVRLLAAGGFNGNSNSSPSTDVFRNIDMSALTLGSYSNQQLLNPTAKACFVSQASSIVMPAISSFSLFDSATRQTAAQAVKDFQSGMSKINCSGYTLKGMDMTILGKLLNLNLASL